MLKHLKGDFVKTLSITNKKLDLSLDEALMWTVNPSIMLTD